MAGGGGDAPPLSGGEFLLQLLQRHHTQTPPQPVPPPSHDPVVGASGPTIHHQQPYHQPFQSSNGHDLPYRPPWSHQSSPSPPLAPHHFFLPQNFPQNPNPNNWPSSSPPQPHNLHLNHNLLSENIQNLAFLSTNPYPNSTHKQQDQNLMFGSLPCKIQNNERAIGPGNPRLNGLEVEFHNSLELSRSLQVNSPGFRNNEHERGGNYRPQPVRRPPPGFSSKQVSGRSGFEQEFDMGKSNFGSMSNRGSSSDGEERARVQYLDKGKSNFSQMSHRGVALDNEERPGVQYLDKGKSNFSKTSNRGSSLDDEERGRVQYGDSSGGRGHGGHRNWRSKPAGDNSRMVLNSDMEDSALELHDEDGEDGDQRRKSELDDSEEQRLIGNLVLEDGSDEKKDRNKNQSSRDKDYRSDKRGQWLLNQRMRNYKRQIDCRSDIERLNAPFLAIYESLIPPEEEKMKQKQLLMLLEKHVAKEWPEAQLYLYGSCANSFGFTKSDIDVCLAIEDAEVSKSEVLLKLADILQSDNLQNVQALTRARVPIVKLMDPATGISCDICVNNVLAVVNTKLLRDYAQIDVRLRQLAFLVKHWAKSRGVNETYQGTLSSYAYVLMCIHFLQQRRPAILPCLQGMERTYAVTFENVECAYFDQVEKLNGFGLHNGESIAQLLWAFFNYWAYCHDYANDVISIRTGSMLSKREKDWTRRIGNDRHLICIEDPFEVTHDLGRVVDKYSIRVLREEFERAAEILQYDPDPCTVLFQPYVPN
ncbi:hypothetical protein LguiB_010929 [Lonicera macranthoides]